MSIFILEFFINALLEEPTDGSLVGYSRDVIGVKVGNECSDEVVPIVPVWESREAVDPRGKINVGGEWIIENQKDFGQGHWSEPRAIGHVLDEFVDSTQDLGLLLADNEFDNRWIDVTGGLNVRLYEGKSIDVRDDPRDVIFFPIRKK